MRTPYFSIPFTAFTAYQYFLRVVPTTYVAPRSDPLITNQYSVTYYTRVLEHNRGTPGIFFKFDMEPMRLTIHQRTTTLAQFLIRCVSLSLPHHSQFFQLQLTPATLNCSWAGVVGGVFVCSAWALRITTRAVTLVAGPSDEDTIAPTPDSAAARASGLRRKWVGGALRARPGSGTGQGRVVRQGNSWVVEGPGGGSVGGSPYSSYVGTPVSAASPYTPYSPAPFSPYSPAPPPPMSARSMSHPGATPAGGAEQHPAPFGLGLPSSAFGPGPASARSPSMPAPSPFLGAANANAGSPAVTPSYAHFPPTPSAGSTAFPRSPAPGAVGFPFVKSPLAGAKKDD